MTRAPEGSRADAGSARTATVGTRDVIEHTAAEAAPYQRQSLRVAATRAIRTAEQTPSLMAACSGGGRPAARRGGASAGFELGRIPRRPSRCPGRSGRAPNWRPGLHGEQDGGIVGFPFGVRPSVAPPPRCAGLSRHLGQVPAPRSLGNTWKKIDCPRRIWRRECEVLDEAVGKPASAWAALSTVSLSTPNGQ